MKSILVTGGTGAFGTAFVKELLRRGMAERIVIYSRDEHKQQRMATALGLDARDRLRYFLGDVRDVSRLRMAMQGCDTVVHAAALKVVPWLEYNPTEGVLTNVNGAANVAEAAIRTKSVERVVALSSDKACNPVNLYGATKLCSEKLFLAANAMGGGRVAFSVVRYGNVSGSTGSVIPLWRAIAEKGEKLPVTNYEMTRFWMTLRQAVELVYATLEGDGGRVVVPRLPSYYVGDLARAVWLEKYRPGEKKVDPRAPDRPTLQEITEHVGIRPGEKVHESMISADESPWVWKRTGAAEGTEGFCIVPDLGDGVGGPGGRIDPAVGPGDGYTKVDPGFAYMSNDGDPWLSTEKLRDKLRGV